MNTSRMPDFSNKSFDGMQSWFTEMAIHDLIFHPDDAPESIVSIITGEKTFTDDECQKLEKILSEMFNLFDDKVYEAAYPAFMKEMVGTK